MSGRIPGHEELRRLLATLIGDGGFAIDDYSNHTWTFIEIAEGRPVDGRHFFQPDPRT